MAIMREKKPLLKTYPLHEGETDSFGAICGGEATVLIEPQIISEALYLIGGGHCARAIAKLAAECGFSSPSIEDRAELLTDLPPAVDSRCPDCSPAEFIASRQWQSDEALVMVSRNHEIDREALAVAVEQSGAGYIGMIGSRRKVRRVFDYLRERGVSDEKLARRLCAARVGHRRGFAGGDCGQHHRGNSGCASAANGETSEIQSRSGDLNRCLPGRLDRRRFYKTVHSVGSQACSCHQSARDSLLPRKMLRSARAMLATRMG